MRALIRLEDLFRREHARLSWLMAEDARRAGAAWIASSGGLRPLGKAASALERYWLDEYPAAATGEEAG